MSYSRTRPRTIAFHLTDEDYFRIKAKAKVAGMTTTDFLTAVALDKPIVVQGGYYDSERLAIELKKLREELQNNGDPTETEIEILMLIREVLSRDNVTSCT